jgi:hypothetical protein
VTLGGSDVSGLTDVRPPRQGPRCTADVGWRGSASAERQARENPVDLDAAHRARPGFHPGGRDAVRDFQVVREGAGHPRLQNAAVPAAESLGTTLGAGEPSAPRCLG